MLTPPVSVRSWMLILVFYSSMVAKIFSWKLGIAFNYNAPTSSKLLDEALRSAHISSLCDFEEYYYIEVYPKEPMKTRDKAIQRGVTVLIGPRDTFSGRIIDVISNELGLLHINLYQEELGENPMRYVKENKQAE